MRQVVTEGALLGVAGCACGLALARFAIALVHKLPEETIPHVREISIDWVVVLLLAGLLTLATLLSSLLPALLASRTDPQAVLQASSRGLGARSGSSRISHWLIIGEVALSTLLLVGTGLLFHTLWNLEHTWLGFDAARVTIFAAMPGDTAGFAGMGVSPDMERTPDSAAETAGNGEGLVPAAAQLVPDRGICRAGAADGRGRTVWRPCAAGRLPSA